LERLKPVGKLFSIPEKQGIWPSRFSIRIRLLPDVIPDFMRLPIASKISRRTAGINLGVFVNDNKVVKPGDPLNPRQ
jgi:hypothetical protein